MKTPRVIIAELIDETVKKSSPRVTLDDIMGESREFHIVCARWECLRKISEKYPHIGPLQLGGYVNMTHKSVIEARKKKFIPKKRGPVPRPYPVL